MVRTIISIHNLHPGFIMMTAGLLIMALPEKFRKPLSLGASIAALAAFLLMSPDADLKYHVTSNFTVDLMTKDRLTMAFLLVFCMIAILCAIYSLDAQDKFESGMSSIYAGCVMSVVLAGDNISFIFFWEMSAFASTYLIYAKHSRRSSRAAFRYIMIHAFGGNMLLAGILMHVAKHGAAFANIANQNDLSFWFILIGVCVNAAIPPFNAWLSDAYPEATITGTVYLGSYTTKAAIYALIRFFAGTEMLVWVGAFMAVYAACMAIMENNLRRLLCYHIVSQLGMMVVSLGVGSPAGIDGASAHATTNIIFKGVMLMGAGAVVLATDKTKITDMGGLAKKMPITAWCFLISSLAIAGLPFLSGFASKALIMHALDEGNYNVPVLLVTAAGIGTLLSITLKINYFVFFGKTDKDVKVRPIPMSMNVAMIIGTLISIVIGLKPDLLYSYMTYQTKVNPFSLDHIGEYIAIFIGGSLPFFVYLEKMKPHDEITVDFDWFYRKPLRWFIAALSKAFNAILTFFDEHSTKTASYLREHFGDPYLWTRKSKNAKIRSMSWENEDTVVGDVIEQIIVTLVILFIVVAMYTF